MSVREFEVALTYKWKWLLLPAMIDESCWPEHKVVYLRKGLLCSPQRWKKIEGISHILSPPLSSSCFLSHGKCCSQFCWTLGDTILHLIHGPFTKPRDSAGFVAFIGWIKRLTIAKKTCLLDNYLCANISHCVPRNQVQRAGIEGDRTWLRYPARLCILDLVEGLHVWYSWLPLKCKLACPQSN